MKYTLKACPSVNGQNKHKEVLGWHDHGRHVFVCHSVVRAVSPCALDVMFYFLKSRAEAEAPLTGNTNI